MSEFITHPLIKENTVELRRYQESIIASCSGKNSLVVLPTGIGKTIIGVGIAAHRLHKIPQSKVLVMAPTKPLVEQHLKSFGSVMRTDGLGKFVILTGNVPPSEREAIYRDNQVIFATPQVIQNDIFTEKLNLKSFSLVVFDEAHRASGNYAYTYIAKKYMEYAKDPLVLGLTASPGGTKEQIGTICANLSIDNVEVRSETDWDVKDYVKETQIEWVKIDFPEELDSVRKNIEAFMSERIKFLYSNNFISNANPRKKELLELQGALGAKLAYDKNPLFFQAISSVASLIKISHALELLESQGPSQLFEYFEKLKSDTSTKSVRNILADENIKKAIEKTSDLHKKGFEHPKLEKVISILKSEISDGKKAMVFAQYIHTIDTIIEKINSAGNSALKPVKFIGQRKGHTQKIQKETLDRFRSGEYNILCSTSVGEEGLDIPKVDVVVFYEPVPSEIRTIQRRGRTGRAKEGKVYILIAKGTIDEAYYWSSRHKERKMKSTLLGLKGGMDKGIKVSSPSSRPKESLESYLLKSEEPIIYLDHRDHKMIKYLSEQNINVKTKQLEVGDIIISERVGIERKTVSDFLESLIDGRLFAQMRDLASNFVRPLLIIEGGNIYGVRNIHPNAIKGALSSIMIDYRIPIIWTKDEKETVYTIISIARREQAPGKGEFQLRASKKGRDLSDIQEYIVSGFPDIDAKISKRILKVFGTVRDFVNAPEEELMKVDGIGKEKARKIREISDTKYEG